MIPSHLRVLFIELLERNFQRVRARRRPSAALAAAAAVLGCLLNHGTPWPGPGLPVSVTPVIPASQLRG